MTGTGSMGVGMEKPLGMVSSIPKLKKKKKVVSMEAKVMAAKLLGEMAMDTGGEPDAIHPSHKQSLRTGSHPLGKVPPLNPHEGEPGNAAERHASSTYRSVIQNLRRYGGVVPNGPRDIQRVGADMMRTLQSLMAREENHKEELEQLAVETALRLPEFKIFRRAIRKGDLHIEAHLGQPDLAAAEMAPEEDEGTPDEPEAVRAEYDEMIAKRKLINTMIQGAAVANNYASGYYAGDELSQIDPGLERDYGKMMAYSELGQFVQGPEVAAAAAGAHGSEAQAGGSTLRREEDGSTTVVAHGLVFPILVHEIVKGCMEYLSIDDEEDPETREAIKNKSDFISDEQYQQQIGPSIWRDFIKALGDDAADVMPYVYDKLNRMPVTEYNAKMKALIDGTPEGQQWFRQVAQQAREASQHYEQEDQEESFNGQALAKRLLG